MKRIFAAFLTLCLGFAISGIAATGTSAAQHSNPASTLKELTQRMSPVKKATYRGYCVRQYFKCRDRWGGSWRFRRCMKWRGCWEAYVDFRERRGHYRGCRRWKEACADNWGYGNNDYYGCLRYHGCD